MFDWLVFIGGLLLLVYIHLTWNFGFWKKKGVPGPEPKVLFGNIPSVITQKKNIGIEMAEIYNKYKGKYSCVGIYSIRKPVLLVVEPSLIKDVLISNFKHFHDNEFADLVDGKSDPIFSKNPFLLKGNEWKDKRAEITPALTVNRLKAMYPLIETVGVDLRNHLRKEASLRPASGIDTRELTACYTTDVVSKAVFGIDADSFLNPNAKIRQMGKELVSQTLDSIFYMMLIELFPAIKKIYKISFVPKHVELFFTELMHNAIEHRFKSKDKRVDYLNYLIELKQKKGLSDLELVSHSITFFFDGFETSSVTMAYMLYEIAKHPEVQRKLRQEIRETESKTGLTFETISEMPYLDQVFNENLRKNPPGTFLSKMCTETCAIPIRPKDGSQTVKIDKGSVVWIPVYGVHRHPDNYPNPDQFDPERFSPENGGVKTHQNKGVFLPFGDGPRICLGMKFATTQVKIGVVEIVKGFEISVNKKTKEPIQMDPTNFLNLAKGGFWLDYKEI